MKRFKSARQAQRFLSVHDQIANIFHVPYPESTTAVDRHAVRETAFAWLARDHQDKRYRLTAPFRKITPLCPAPG
jgi:hypothetical protein